MREYRYVRRICMERIQVHCTFRKKKKRKLKEEYGCHLEPGIPCASQSKEGLVVENLQDQHVWIKNSLQKRKKAGEIE